MVPSEKTQVVQTLTAPRCKPGFLLAAATVLVAAGALLCDAPAATAQGPATCEELRVAKVTGLLDPVLVDFVEGTVEAADACGAVAVILQLDSPGAVVDRDRFDELLATIDAAEVPITVWVGPSGAQAADEAFELVEAADVSGVAPGSRLRPEGRPSLGSDEAVEAGVADLGGRQAATIGDFAVNLADHGIPVESIEVDEGDEIRRQPVTRTRFAALSLVDQLAHTVASPPVAYLLFTMGMALLIFELYTAGVGVAGLVGAAFVVLGSYGLYVLSATPIGIALLVLAMFGFAVDVQTGVPRVWTGVGTVAFVAGSLLLYDEVALSWITLVIGVAGIMLFMLGAMPAMVRSRFSTPTIGREWMIGEHGVARTPVSPDGTVDVRDAPWRARTNRATPIAAGDPVRVAAIDGLVLEVEPLEGAARDYRERSAH
jgi:membrane-bound serine protease (ClpP class)